MKKFNASLKKIFSRKLTIMLIPHTAFRPFQIHFTFSFALFVFTLWTGLTSWATWAVMSNVDYWSMKTSHQVLKLKVLYFANELNKSREVLDQVREADIQLRQLLGMKERRAIIEQEGEDKGSGGPTIFDASILQKTLARRLWDISDSEIRYESEAVLKESQERIQSFKEISEHIAYERSLYRHTPRGWPTSGRTTSHFGARISPFTGQYQFHSGIDIANETGTPVIATGDGVVQLAGWEGGYGRLVIIDHGYGYLSYYGHNNAVAVNVGDRVRRGQVIAYMGSSGSSTGPHTHYEIWYNGRCLNPWKFLVGGNRKQDLTDLAEEKSAGPALD